VSRYADDSRDNVRDAVDMVDLVSKRTELRRAGADHYTGLCPFHDERTPSFGISPSKKVFNCFGCGQSGDCFNFVMETEGLDFVASMEALAERYGVTLERQDEDPAAAERRKQRERLYELLDRTTNFYSRYLWESDEAAGARAYLEERGLSREILATFRVGYAPSAWDKVLTASMRGGFSARDVWDAGLASRSRQGNERLYDRFRRRIMFPLADPRGRVLGFGARALGADQQPKYVNTSDNQIYHKGDQLYATHLARASAAKANRVVMCEGYTDVIALHQAGIENAVGIMGTAFTTGQLTQLRKLALTGLVALDADSAGHEAMLRAAEVARKEGVELRIVRIPPGSDPADLVREKGADAVRELVDGSVQLQEFQVDYILAAEPLDTAEAKDRALEKLRPVLGSLPDSIVRAELVRKAADRLDLTQDLLASLLARPARRRAESGDGGGAAPPPRVAEVSQSERTERTFLALCIALPELGREALRKVDLDRHFTTARTRKAAAHLRDHLATPLDGVPDEDAELLALLTELTIRAERDPAPPATLDAQTIALDRRRLEREIKAAQEEGGTVADLAAELTRNKQDLDAAMDRATQAAGD
jgi:DNA primase